MNLDAPLSDEEIAELDTFLMSDATPDDCMDIVALDGFLTALMTGPGLVPPSVWLPVIWGGKGEPGFESSEQAQRVLSLIMRRWNAIGQMLGENPPAFEPIFYEREGEGGTIRIADDWCAGFMTAVDLSFDDWQKLFDDKPNCALLVPILTLGTEEGWKELDAAADPQAEYAAALDLLEPSVVALDAYWKLRWRKKTAALKEASSRPRSLRSGRNDQCPCGSGRKFKKCCAAENAS